MALMHSTACAGTAYTAVGYVDLVRPPRWESAFTGNRADRTEIIAELDPSAPLIWFARQSKRFSRDIVAVAYFGAKDDFWASSVGTNANELLPKEHGCASVGGDNPPQHQIDNLRRYDETLK